MTSTNKGGHVNDGNGRNNVAASSWWRHHFKFWDYFIYESVDLGFKAEFERQSSTSDRKVENNKKVRMFRWKSRNGNCFCSKIGNLFIF